jgi:hypothetical protein
MSIPKRPATKTKAAADAFIEQAPDAKPTRWQRGTKTQITFSVDPGLLERIDEVAKRKYLSRAALMTLWLNERLEQEAER